MKHFLGINWLVRVRNPVFWAQVVVALFVPMLTQMGMVWDQITTWGVLWQVVLRGISNPVTVVAMLLSVWNAVNDPTTSGLKDSSRALSYDKPGEVRSKSE